MFALVVQAADDIVISPPAHWGSLANITIGSLVSGAVQLALVTAALIFFFILVIGGIKWILSGGDENKVKGAKGQITNALIGLAIVFVAWAIGRMLQSIFGVNIFSLSLPKIY